MSLKNIQFIAINVLEVVLEGHNLVEVLTSNLDVKKLNSAELAALRDICYGSLRFYGTLRYWIKQMLTQSLSNNKINLLLIIALYQLNYSQNANYAVVNEAVDLAKSIAKGKYKNLVNALLRRFLREKNALQISSTTDLEALYNLPQWWIDKLQADYPDKCDDLFKALAERPALTLRVNRRILDARQYCIILQQHNIAAECWGPYAVNIKKPIPVQQLPFFAEGYVSVQDLGAQMAAELLNVKQGSYVLDACSAPGGKTTHILEMSECELLALDISEKRLKKVAQNLARLKLSAQLKCADAYQLDTWFTGRQFDYILADVPCTASGVIKRNPDIRWIRRADDGLTVAAAQIGLLDNLWTCLKIKGKMLLVTCSFFKEENQLQTARFLNRNQDAKLVKEIQLLPDYRHDGFYYALFEKN